MKIKLNTETLKIISFFEKITGVGVKDCFEEENLYFIIPEILLWKAIGKGGSNVKKLEKLFKKKVVIIGYSDKLEKFIQNIIFVFGVNRENVIIEINELKVNLIPTNIKTRGILIGKNKKNLDLLKMLLNKFFNITNVNISYPKKEI